MEGIKERSVDQVEWPNHGSGVDKELPHDTCDTVSQHLSSQSEEKLPAKTEVLAIECSLG